MFYLLLALTMVSCLPKKSTETFSNPILPGFHPDPSICRVGEDYTWSPIRPNTIPAFRYITAEIW
jgi:beta-xylosidase